MFKKNLKYLIIKYHGKRSKFHEIHNFTFLCSIRLNNIRGMVNTTLNVKNDSCEATKSITNDDQSTQPKEHRETYDLQDTSTYKVPLDGDVKGNIVLASEVHTKIPEASPSMSKVLPMPNTQRHNKLSW